MFTEHERRKIRWETKPYLIKMEIQSKLTFGLLIVSGIIILFVMLRSKHFIRSLILSALQGVAALFAVNLFSAVTGFELAVNPVTLSVSALGGMSGVILLLISRCIIG